MPKLLSNQNDIKESLARVEKQISDACVTASRHRQELVLVAVSKGHDFSAVRHAFQLGVRDFGESYAQEMAQKMTHATKEGLNGIRWHFIGSLQSNKLKIIKEADVVHSVGSIRHAAILNRVATKDIDIFLQVNLDEKSTQQGFLPDEVLLAVTKCMPFERLKLRGLMAILPQSSEPKKWFLEIVHLKDAIIRQGLMPCVLLSMGMSEDFIPAIQYGTNFLRIGTKIFGTRN